NVTFPEQYGEPSLAGKPAVFKVKLNEIHSKELPELDDEFAKDVSEFDTLDELKADIRKNLTEQADKRANADFENALMEKIVDSMEGEIPAVLIEERIDDQVREFAYNMSAQGLGLDMYLKFTGSTPEALRESMRESATKQVKTRLALEAIARAEGFEVTDEEIDAEYQRYADDYNMDKAKVMEMVPVKSMRKDLACSKALDLVRTSGKVSKAKKAAKKDEE
ncbi:MAG: trigger factor, partial [Oscillospiraceae bacterium]|nr:trigger factor [Oscillospiraceae bacterium]